MTTHWSERFEAIRSVAGVLAKTPLAGGRSEGEVLACLLAGDELGSGPIESLTRLYVRKGRVEAHADFLRTLCERAGVRVTVIVTGSASAARATVDVRRPDGTGGAVTWTMQDAKRAGVDGEECWISHPVPMLIARATVEAIRAHVGEVLGPLTYTTGEGAEIERCASRRQRRATRSDPFPGEAGAPLRIAPQVPPEKPVVPQHVDPEPEGDDTATSAGGNEDGDELTEHTDAAEREPPGGPEPVSPGRSDESVEGNGGLSAPLLEGWVSIEEAQLAHARLVAEAAVLSPNHPGALRLAEVAANEGLMDRDRFVAARRAVEAAVAEAEPLIGQERRNDGPAPRRTGAPAAVPLAERVAVMAKRMNRGTRCV